MLIIRRTAELTEGAQTGSESHAFIDIFKEGEHICELKVLHSWGEGQVEIGCTADQSVTFLRGEVPFNPDLTIA